MEKELFGLVNNKEVYRYTLNDYNVRGGYVCGVIGRVANRIAKAKFNLNGHSYQLTKNEGDNQLHGGLIGFHHKFYEVFRLYYDFFDTSLIYMNVFLCHFPNLFHRK